MVPPPQGQESMHHLPGEARKAKFMPEGGRVAILIDHVGRPSEVFIRRHIEYFGEHARPIVKRRLPADEAAWGEDLTVEVLPKGASLPKRLAQLRSLMLVGDRRTMAGATNKQRRALTRTLRDVAPAAVLVEYLSPWLSYLPDIARMRVPIFGHAHGYDVSQLVRDPRWAHAYGEWNRADGVVVPSSHIKARLVNLGIDQAKLHVIPYGVEVPGELPRPGTAATKPFRFVAVGRMVQKKAPLATLEAFHSVSQSNPEVHLDMVGDGPLKESAEAYVREHGLGHCVTLWGPQPHGVVRSIMRGGDAFVQHSRVDPETGDEEGLPVAILEAMAEALPVVATRHAGIPESVVDGETGYLVQEEDIHTMRDAMEALSRDRNTARALGAHGWRRAAERFSVERQRSSLRQLLLAEQ